MKKSLKICLLAVIYLLTIVLAACENYPEGVPSFFSSEYRIVNMWQVSKSYVNGDTISETEYLAFAPRTYYYIYADHVLTVLAYYNGELRESSFATYILNPKNKTLEVNFSLVNKRYHLVADVRKLSRSELIIEFDDENGDHRRLEMFARLNS